MARTVTHVPFAYRDGNHNQHTDPGVRCDSAYSKYGWFRGRACDYTGPAHALTDLRYSALSLVVASRTGTRPSPQPVTVTLERLSGARRWVNCDTLGVYVNARERRARQSLRVDARNATGYANAILADLTVAHEDDVEDLWDVLYDATELRPVRHRHSGMWDCW